MKKQLYILLIIITTISILVPPQLFAGVNKVEQMKGCCSAKSHAKKSNCCCKKDSATQKQHTKQKGCEKEGCGCTGNCTTASASVAGLPVPASEKISYNNATTHSIALMPLYLSPGFCDIWQPPKI